MGVSIKSKLAAFCAVLVLAVLACQLIFNLFLSKPYFIHLKQNEAQKLYTRIQTHYSDDPNVLYEITQDMADIYNFSIFVYSEQKLLYSNRNASLPILLNAFLTIRSSERALFLENPTPRIVQSGRTEKENIVLTGKLEYGGSPRYIMLLTPVESIDANVQMLTTINSVISILILVAGSVGAYIFAGRFSKPVTEIEKVAQNVANLNFSIRADESISTTELRSLSGSINTMSDKLRSLITELTVSNARLQEDIEHQMRLDKMRREFVANVSHELKNPLHLLLIYSENLKNNIDGIDKDYYCNTIMEETNRLNDMVVSLLDLSAIENGLSKMHTEALDFSQLADAVLSKTKVLFAGITVRIQIEDGIQVTGDRHYLEQAMKNYIANAVSHTSPGGEIAISLHKRDSAAVFSVFNEGEAIAPEALPYIWDSFYKADRARVRTEEPHAGLGLYIVKTIVTAHGGEHGSMNRENGVEFWFSLPATQE